jgi:hypothetical protein
MGRPGMTRVAIRLLLAGRYSNKPQGCTPVGNKVLSRGSEKARFDQQPIEASAMVSACLEFIDPPGSNLASRGAACFSWFLGQNDLGLPVLIPPGGCRDGLHPDRANKNQGAESTLAFLLSLAEMRFQTGSILTVAREAKTHPDLKTTAPSRDQGEIRSW